jgi:ACS family glucarate transporter-like MFS transporter
MAHPGTTSRPPSSTVRPTRARYWVIVFAVTLAILSYIDRVAISLAATPIMTDLNLTRTQMGYLFSAFAIAYALFEVPGGWMGDWIGARKVLMRIVIWWSVFTALTGFMWNFLSMYAVRFLFGAGEAGCFPNLTKAFSAWLPTDERVRAQGIMWTFARWGGAFTPPLVVFMFQFMSWRAAFVVFGLMGVVWAVAFFRWFRDNPRDHASVNEAELAIIEHENAAIDDGHGVQGDKRTVITRLVLFTVATLAVAGLYASRQPSMLSVVLFCVVIGALPLYMFLQRDIRGKLVRSRTVWLLWAQYFLITYPWYFYITWLPTFLRDRYPSLSDGERAGLAIMPLFFGGVGSLFCAFVSNFVTRFTGSMSQTRRIMACIGFFGAAAMLLIFVQLQNTTKESGLAAASFTMFFLGMTSFFNDLVMPGAWATCMDVGGKLAGTVSGSMNMMGNAAGFVAPVVGGKMLDADMGWTPFLYTMAASYVLGGLCWPFIRPEDRLDTDDQPVH